MKSVTKRTMLPVWGKSASEDVVDLTPLSGPGSADRALIRPSIYSGYRCTICGTRMAQGENILYGVMSCRKHFFQHYQAEYQRPARPLVERIRVPRRHVVGPLLIRLFWTEVYAWFRSRRRRH